MKGIQQKSFQLRSCSLNAPSNSSICFLPSLSSLINIFLSNIFYLYSFSLICSCSADSLLAFFLFPRFCQYFPLLNFTLLKIPVFSFLPSWFLSTCTSNPRLLSTLRFHSVLLTFLLILQLPWWYSFRLIFFPMFFSKKRQSI